MMRRSLRAFTLIELLVVIAITAILLTLIIIPVIESFNLTRAAQAFADAQDKARVLIERIQREVANSTGVRDTTGDLGAVAVWVPGRPVALGGTNNGNPEAVLLPNTKLDIVKPAEGEPIRGTGGALLNPNLLIDPNGDPTSPTNWKEDPTLKAPRGQVVLPVGQGYTIVRYFVGIRDPFSINPDTNTAYANPYDGLLMRRTATRDNLFVLYRAEVQPYVWNSVLGRFVVNKALFFDQNRDNDPNTSGPKLDDPFFFDTNTPVPAYTLPDPTGTPDPTKDQVVRNWLRASTVVTEVSRYDMVLPVYNKANRQVTYDGNKPRLLPLVRFQPSRISNAPADGMSAIRLGEETDNMTAIAPDTFKTRFGGWANLIVRLYPNNWVAGTPYLIERPDSTGTKPGPSIYYYDPAGGQPEMTSGTELFDIETYTQSIAQGLPFPFTRAITAANGRSAWLGNLALRNAFLGWKPNSSSGKLIASFSIEEVGQDASFAATNFPTVGTGVALSPVNDPNVGGNFYDPAYDTINKKFNKVWADNPALRPNIHRFVDLRTVAQPDGTASPLNPDPATGFARAKLVPGSEIVVGPDQNPGANYGAPVRYTRTTRTPGPNQYRINYVDQPEPTDWALLGLPNPPANYTATDFVSAIIQPRYKAGYIQFNSDPNVPLPTGNITVRYRFQFTGPGDTVAVDYDTRQIIEILLTVRNYPQSSVPNPQTVTVRGMASVRNFLR